MLVIAHDARWRLATRRHLDGRDFVSEEAVSQGLCVAGLGGGRKTVALDTAQAQLGGDVVGGLWHGVIAVRLAQPGVGETGADGTVEHLELASIGSFALAHHKGRARHALYPAGNVEGAFADGDGAGGIQHGGQSAAAQPVDSLAGNAHRQSGQQSGMAGNVAAVFAGLAGTAEQHVFHLLRLERAVGQQFLDDSRGQIVRAHRGKAAALAAKGGTQSCVEVGVEHGVSPEFLVVGCQWSGVSSDRPSWARRRNQGLGR